MPRTQYRTFLKRALCTTCVLTLALIPQLAGASDDLHANDDHAGDGHAMKKHVLGVFVGVTATDDTNESTTGMEYEYRVNEYIGVGGLIENTPGAHHGDGTSLYMLQVHAHPWKDLRVTAGYGQEDIHHDGADNEEVLRFGLAYDFHLSGFGIAPTVNFDSIDGETVTVYGIVFNKGF